MYSQIHTFAECRSCILKMLERYSSNGIENSCGEMKDIEKRLVASINIHMRKLYAQFFRKTERKTVILETNYESGKESDFCISALPENFAKIYAIYNDKGFPVHTESFEVSPITRSISAENQMAGKYILEYYIYPERLSENCGEDAEILLPPILFDALCYMCASDLCPSSDGELFSKLTYKYREILENYYDRTKNLSSGRNSFYRLTGRIGRKNAAHLGAITKNTEG